MLRQHWSNLEHASNLAALHQTHVCQVRYGRSDPWPWADLNHGVSKIIFCLGTWGSVASPLCCHRIFPFAVCSDSTPFVVKFASGHKRTVILEYIHSVSICPCCNSNPESVSWQSRRLTMHPNYRCTYQYHNHNLHMFPLTAEAIVLTSGQFYTIATLSLGLKQCTLLLSYLILQY